MRHSGRASEGNINCNKTTKCWLLTCNTKMLICYIQVIFKPCLVSDIGYWCPAVVCQWQWCYIQSCMKRRCNWYVTLFFWEIKYIFNVLFVCLFVISIHTTWLRAIKWYRIVSYRMGYVRGSRVSTNPGWGKIHGVVCFDSDTVIHGVWCSPDIQPWQSICRQLTATDYSTTGDAVKQPADAGHFPPLQC